MLGKEPCLPGRAIHATVGSQQWPSDEDKPKIFPFFANIQQKHFDVLRLEA
jgi:hypothetical protein